MRVFLKVSPLLLLLGVVACVSREAVVDDYTRSLRNSPEAVQLVVDKKPRTTVVFLIDGLSDRFLKKEIAAGKLPHIAGYFGVSQDQRGVFQAHNGFPSLTYPNISSLLTASPVDSHGVSGNLLLENGQIVSLESPFNRDKLDEHLRGKTVFSKLADRHLTSASFAYMFGEGATSRMAVEDLEVGLSIVDEGYATIDAKTINSFDALLTQTPIEKWPSFIFVHLIGFDLISHDNGPDAKANLEYLESLDSKLKHVLDFLNYAVMSGRRSVVSLLTADHGFDQRIVTTPNIENVLREKRAPITVINEGRYVGLYFSPRWSFEERRLFLAGVARRPDVSLVAEEITESPDYPTAASTAPTGSIAAIALAERAVASVQDPTERRVEIFSHREETVLRIKAGACPSSPFLISTETALRASSPFRPAPAFFCPDFFDRADVKSQTETPFLTTNLAHYFRASSHPDAVIVAASGVSFTARYLGNHGGVTRDEVVVPLLMRGAKLSDPQQIPALWDLLRFLLD